MSWVSASPKSSPKRLVDNEGNVAIDRTNFGPPDITSSEIEYVTKIGEGKYGAVYEGKCRGNRVAIKKFHKQTLSPSVLNEFKSEVEIISRLNHPNVVLFMGACTEPGEMAIVSELCERGNLHSLLYNTGAGLSIYRKMMMAKDIAIGMTWLHGADPHIVHRDLKPQNLLVGKHGDVKVCDFGFSTIKDVSSTVQDDSNYRGSPLWCAPEVFRGHELTEKVDVYAFAMVLWEIIMQETPFPEISNYMGLRAAILYKKMRPPLDKIEPESLRDLISNCWDEEPSNRPNFREIILRINDVIVDCCIIESNIRNFWKDKYPDVVRVPFKEFINCIVSYFDLPEINSSTMDCLDIILASSYNFNGTMVPEKVVNIENFGNFLNTFGPFIKEYDGKKKDIFGRVNSICKRPWFFGHIEKNEIDRLFRGQSIGNFLVRQSFSTPGCFTLSYISNENAIRHQRILNSGIDGFITVDRLGNQLNIVPPSHSLNHIVEELKIFFQLTDPVPDSPYFILYNTTQPEESGDYSNVSDTYYTTQ